MALELLANIKEELTCPICLDLLVEPVSPKCGHTFCQACISAQNTELEYQKRKIICPVCQRVYYAEKLHPNRSVANIVEKLRQVKSSTEEEQKKDLCVRHGEKLLLFCKMDGKVICWLCERSQEHRGHHTFLMEEVAQEYQEKLQSVLERLREEEQEAKKLEADFREEKASWKIQIQNEKQSVQEEFKQLRDILDSEEKKELEKLVNEEEDILDDLAEAENRVTQYSGSLRELISDLERRLKGSTMELLQDVNHIIKRSETLTLKKPKAIPKKQGRVFQMPDMRRILQMFDELLNGQR
ncbi:tripartite motif-containing protein 5-like [Manis pentadactyla]|uniref:tripartite motif-containing protein 5-like n=1 Tax=Manis pentadactyla TaxID=143292 RepID=UPI00255CA3B1|nr:tripartite motif-containing protein 5-like [Manis pentadactyla]XP_057363259.1 tripartite motif-containing protein 5-like [Manis pentadactyla]XP_057363260.1 tripartite motif-containing protein 5-like [Manis pentadactyla]XP_057363261.1 tripartite motif-containing protein 5-like [Manis pentadactyla]